MKPMPSATMTTKTTDDPTANPTAAPTPHRWLRWFCAFTIATTFSLIAVGGKVTSYDYGMAIEQGWTTGGVVSFLAPLEYWWYQVDKRWEHLHRIMGTVVGLLTIVMAVGLWRTQKDRPWLKWTGVVLLVLVCIQGALGATRVNEVSLLLAFFHGITGQVILCTWIVVMAALSDVWLSRRRSIREKRYAQKSPVLRWAVRLLLVALVGQLTLGAAVRHFKADKAIPDFPTTYGQVLPPMSQDSLDASYIEYHSARADRDDSIVTNRTPQGEIVVALSDVDLQYAHRLGAVVVSVLGLGVIVAALRRQAVKTVVGPSLSFVTLLVAQFALGIVTVLTGTDPIIATLHQATGALLIAVSTWLALRIHLAEFAPAAMPAAAYTSILNPPHPDAIGATQSSASPLPAPANREPLAAS